MRSRCFLVAGAGVGTYVPAVLHPLGRVLTAAGVADALRFLLDERETLTGVFVDAVMPDGSGFDVIERARVLEMGVPIILVTKHRGDRFGREINRCFGLDATCLPAPMAPDLLLISVERWDQAEAEDEAADEAFIQRHVADTGADVLEVKALIEGILEKTGARTLAEVSRRMHREALKAERGLRPRTVPVPVGRTRH